MSQTKSRADGVGVRSSVSNRDSKGRFVKGHKTWNKDLKGIHLSPKSEFKRGHVPANKGKSHPYGHKWKKGERVSPKTEIKNGQHLSRKTEFTSKRAKAFWEDKKLRRKMLIKQAKSRRRLPSKPEKRFMEINEEYDLGFTYTGNSPEVIIGRFRPDFVNFARRIIVEIFGDYWHRRPKVIERDIRRFKAYRIEEYRTVFLWASELKNEEKVIRWFV